MVGIAFKATSHVACWIVWHSLGVSLLDDLDAPRPPAGEQPATQAAYAAARGVNRLAC